MEIFRVVCGEQWFRAGNFHPGGEKDEFFYRSGTETKKQTTLRDAATGRGL